MEIFDLNKALADMGDDMEIYQEVLQSYLEDAPQLISNIEKAYENKDIESLNRNAHSLKSSSRTVGGIKLGKAAENLEYSTKENIPQDCAILIDTLKKEYNTFIETLKEQGMI